jgi:hypothetical protein
LYNDGNSSFSSDEFWAFKSLVNFSHDYIHMKWVVDLNDNNEQLAYFVNGEKIWATHNDPLSKLQIVLTQESFQSLISQMKSECLGKF